MAYEGYKLIRFARDGKIVTATVDAPPINIITLALYSELSRMSREVEADQDCLVFILKSANPDFFLAHFDVSAILQFPIDKPASREASTPTSIRHVQPRPGVDKVTISAIESRSVAAAASSRWDSTCASGCWEDEDQPNGVRWASPGRTGTRSCRDRTATAPSDHWPARTSMPTRRAMGLS